jgi:hypothetical protein
VLAGCMHQQEEAGASCLVPCSTLHANVSVQRATARQCQDGAPLAPTCLEAWRTCLGCTPAVTPLPGVAPLAPCCTTLT